MPRAGVVSVWELSLDKATGNEFSFWWNGRKANDGSKLVLASYRRTDYAND